MKVLHLTLKKKWYDMILFGEKKEEYREFKKYWVTRLSNKHDGAIGGDFMDAHKVISYTFKEFDEIIFKNGYATDSPTMRVKCNGITYGEAQPQWSYNAEGVFFIIKLGEILEHSPF